MVKTSIYHPVADIIESATANDDYDYDYTEYDLEEARMDDLVEAKHIVELRAAFALTPAGVRHEHLSNRWSDIQIDEQYEPSRLGAELKFIGYRKAFDERNPHLLGPVPAYAITVEYPGSIAA
jgi:hypothetical protein